MLTELALPILMAWSTSCLGERLSGEELQKTFQY